MQIIKKGRILALMFMLLGCLAIQASDDLITKQITIKLDKAGTLPDKIGSTKKYKITNLKIVGEINGTDWVFIRDMAGGGLKDYSYTNGKLSVLDLSEAKIVEGGDCYYYDVVKYYTSNDRLGDYAFSGCNELTSLSLPSGITFIGNHAFQDCWGLTSFVIPSKVTTIGVEAFYGCSGLTSLVIPSSVTSIGESAFSDCSGLPSLVIPSNVTSIWESAFNGCSGLTSVYVSWQTPLRITTSVFSHVDKTKCTLYVPQEASQDYWLADVWGDFENIVEYDVTEVDNVTTSTDAKEISRYSVNGQRLATPTKGLNIVKYSDGSVKKVAVQ